MRVRWALVALSSTFLSGCAQSETARFQVQPDHEATVRDSQSAIVSKQKNSVVMFRPGHRQFQAGRGPVQVVAVYNYPQTSLQLNPGPEGRPRARPQRTEVVKETAPLHPLNLTKTPIVGSAEWHQLEEYTKRREQRIRRVVRICSGCGLDPERHETVDLVEPTEGRPEVITGGITRSQPPNSRP